MITPEQAREITRRAVELTPADEAEALVSAESSALTRFANNRIHQNVAEENTTVRIRAVFGGKVGVASTNRLDEASLRQTAEAAAAAAFHAVPDDAFPGLPEPSPVTIWQGRASDATRALNPDARAHAVASIVAQSASRDLTAAGKVSAAERVTAVSNSHGVDVGMATTDAHATVLSMGPGSGSGWASFLGTDSSAMNAIALGDQAATLAQRTANPISLEPGTYPVILSAEAVADVLDFLAYVGFSAKAVEEGRSFMSGHLGEKLMAAGVSIVDDAVSPHAMGIAFDYEGMPRRRVVLVEDGAAVQPVTDSYWSARTGRSNTGHALPAPNSYGPMPLNLEMLPGDAAVEDLISSVTRGVFVTRFHYVNVEDPIAVTLTGMTRDGTLLIENGRLTHPLKNLRFTQSAVEALAGCEGVTRERRFVGTDEGASLAPSILVRAFSFTGQTT